MSSRGGNMTRKVKKVKKEEERRRKDQDERDKDDGEGTIPILQQHCCKLALRGLEPLGRPLGEGRDK
jgi:hypothetical protein